MVARSRHALFVGVLVAAATACAPYVKRGSTLYEEGRFIEAAEVFERTEDRLGESDATVRCEYGLYRGLTYLELGDHTRARDWFAYTLEVERKSPGTLSSDERARLEQAWAAAERGSTPPATSDSTIAQRDDASVVAPEGDPAVEVDPASDH